MSGSTTVTDDDSVPVPNEFHLLSALLHLLDDHHVINVTQAVDCAWDAVSGAFIVKAFGRAKGVLAEVLSGLLGKPFDVATESWQLSFGDAVVVQQTDFT